MTTHRLSSFCGMGNVSAKLLEQVVISESRADSNGRATHYRSEGPGFTCYCV